MTPLEQISARIIEAVPEIMRVEFGCEILKGGTHFIVVGTMPSGDPITVKKSGVYDTEAPAGAHMEKIEKGATKIIGRRITLCDVMLATEYWAAKNETFNRGHFILKIWDFRSPLDKQDPAVIARLHEMLFV